MIWTDEPKNGIAASTLVRFVDKDTIEYHVVAKDKDGKVYLDMQGKMTRRK